MSKLFVGKVRFVIGAALVAVVLAGCEPAEPVANVESGARKVAVFEGGEVTQGEVQEFAEQSGLGELSPSSPQYDAAIQQIMPQLVELEIAKAYARENGITVSSEEVDAEIEKVKDQLAQQARQSGQDVGREEAFAQALQQAGLSEADLRAQIQEQLPIQKVQQRVTGDAEPSQDEVESFYKENKDQFTTPEQRCARHILFNKDQKQKAEEVADELKSDDGDFADLAKEFSQDPGSAENGGDLGCLGQGETVPPFDKAMFAADEGEVVGPVETEFGFHVIEVTEKRQERTQPLEEVEGQIRDQLTGEKQSEEFASWLEKQKKQRDVRYLDGYKPAQG